MTQRKNARGYFDRILAMDCETTGLAINCDDPSFNPSTGDTFQSISWGLIVADAYTLQPIDEMYIEIKWDGRSVWDTRAENIHGLSREHLNNHGVTSDDAVVEICNFLLQHWKPTDNIRCLGHNVHMFDLYFFKRLLRSQGIDLRFGNRHVDTNSIGFATVGAFNSDDLFNTFELGVRDASKHNALEDARLSLQVVRRVRKLWDKRIGLSAYED